MFARRRLGSLVCCGGRGAGRAARRRARPAVLVGLVYFSFTETGGTELGRRTTRDDEKREKKKTGLKTT
jgi:hypothetical protein